MDSWRHRFSRRPDRDNEAGRGRPSLVWKARPIFISSTFRDMHAERDHLRRVEFPRLADQLRERCHYLDTIDLRQGVESAGEIDEARREMQVLKVCLDEIERSKPFLVALLGDRYGWIPPTERITAAARDAGLLASVEVAGCSVTELEILYGVLQNPDQRKRSWFYFRTLDHAGLPEEVSARFPAEESSDDPTSPAGRLRALKDRIRREMPERVRDYTLRWDSDRGELIGLEAFGRLVTADLWSDLDNETVEFLRQAPRTWQEADVQALDDFVAERTRGYVERPAVTDPMLEHALSPPAPDAAWGLSVTGESGGGKSSLFGRVYDALQPRVAAGEIVLLAHAAGIFPMSSQVDRILRRWVSELAAHLGQADPLERPDEPQDAVAAGPRRPDGPAAVTSSDIDQAFASLLGQTAARRRVVVLVDALNQFEPTIRAQYMTWLPKLWPNNARFIATAIPCPATATLHERKGCRELPVPPVTPEEAREIARRFYRERHHRDTDPRVLDALLAKQLPTGGPAHGNPLWLALALQEMNLLEADDFERADQQYAALPGAERMRALQLDEARKLPADVPGVYGELLDRAERGFGKAWARAFTGLIAVSRAGWRESDLRGLMPAVSGQPWDDLAFADVRRALGTHVVQRGAQAQWDFFHAALRETVLRRGLADDSARRRLHGLIADHLESLPTSDQLRIDESMVHLLGLDDRDRAADYLAAIQARQWTDADAKSALAAAVAVMVEAIRSATNEGALERLTGRIAALMGGEDGERCGRVASAVIFDLADALAVTGEARTEQPRLRLLEATRATLKRLTAADPLNLSWQRDLSVSQDMIGAVQQVQGDLAGALEAFRQSLGVRERLAAADPTNADWQQNLSASQNRIGDVLLAQGDLDGALGAYRYCLGVAERLAAADPSNASWQRDLASDHCLVGIVLQQQGRLADALDSYRKYHEGMARLAAADPSNAGWQRDLGIGNERLGDVLLAQGNLIEARRAYEAKQVIVSRLAAADPSNADRQLDLSVSHIKIGDALLAQGDLIGTIEAYRQFLGVAERLAAADPSNAGWQRDLSMSRVKIADVLLAQGHLADALEAYRQSLGVAERLAAADPSNANWQRDLSVSQNRIGDVLLAQGELAGALEAYRQSLGLTERLAAAEPSNADWQCDLGIGNERLGDVLLAQRNLLEASRAYEAKHLIVSRLAAADPSNAGWQRDLSVSYIKIGNVLLAQDDLAGAIEAYRQSLGIAERLAAADTSNAGWQRDLASVHCFVGNVLQQQGRLADALDSFRKYQVGMERLTAADPSNANWQRDLSVSQNRIGDVLLAQGELAGALEAYRQSLGIAERLTATDPTNAAWQRDLMAIYGRMAVLITETDQNSALTWWRKAYRQLSSMKQRGIMLPTDAQYLEYLKHNAGG